MTMPNAFSVELFYGDIGFTADYSNVLQFDDEKARDDYFDDIQDKITIMNTDLNNINIGSNKVKIAFTDKDDIDKLEKYNYIRIKSILYGTHESYKQEYGFIIDFNIVTSYSDITVVEFTYIVDIWQNYQFSFALKECNVARCHMDRWNSNGDMIYTRPSKDALESYMGINLASLISEKKEVICMEYTGSFDEHQRPYFKIVQKLKDVVVCIVSIATNGKEDDSKLQYLYFPVTLDGSAIVERTTFTLNTEHSLSEILSSNAISLYPTLKEVLSGNIANLFDKTPSGLFNSQILVCSSVQYYNYEGRTEDEQTFNGTWIDGFEDKIVREPFYLLTFNITHAGYEYSGNLDFDVSPVYLPWNDEVEVVINPSIPIKPIDNADYSTVYEPMLYKNPIMQRFIVSANGSEMYEIPDVKFPVNKLYVNNMISPGEGYTVISTDSLEDDSQVIAKNMPIGAIGSFLTTKTDLLIDAWQEYCMTQRDSDRKMMWSNILTSGMAETGSTFVSAGIGYRSNQERAEMYSIYGGLDLTKKAQIGGNSDEGQLMRMYMKYGEQAMLFSGIGGMTAFGANAVGNAMSQASKEKAIKNQPANISNTGGWFGEATKKIVYPSYVELRCDDKSFEQYANIFKKYGYAINGVMTPNIKSRKYFDYIKTNGAIITGDANQRILTSLCSIFDNGVTIWHMDNNTPETLYKYNKENIERSLM